MISRKYNDFVAFNFRSQWTNPASLGRQECSSVLWIRSRQDTVDFSSCGSENIHCSPCLRRRQRWLCSTKAYWVTLRKSQQTSIVICKTLAFVSNGVEEEVTRNACVVFSCSCNLEQSSYETSQQERNKFGQWSKFTHLFQPLGWKWHEVQTTQAAIR